MHIKTVCYKHKTTLESTLNSYLAQEVFTDLDRDSSVPGSSDALGGGPVGQKLEMQSAAPSATSRHASVAAPAFDADFMRWVPIVVPLVGVATVLLTGLMWVVAS